MFSNASSAPRSSIQRELWAMIDVSTRDPHGTPVIFRIYSAINRIGKFEFRNAWTSSGPHDGNKCARPEP
jgi:hypothetical protein